MEIVANQAITAVEHRGVYGLLTSWNDGTVYGAGKRYGVPIESEPAKFDLFEKNSKVQANWNRAVDAYFGDLESRN